MKELFLTLELSASEQEAIETLPEQMIRKRLTNLVTVMRERFEVCNSLGDINRDYNIFSDNLTKMFGPRIDAGDMIALDEMDRIHTILNRLRSTQLQVVFMHEQAARN